MTRHSGWGNNEYSLGKVSAEISFLPRPNEGVNAMTASTPQCICGPTCENRGHCRIPHHHRMGCPVYGEIGWPDSQYPDHRELLAENPAFASRASLIRAIDGAEQIIGRSILRCNYESEDEPGRYCKLTTGHGGSHSEFPRKMSTCGHDECAGNYTCHREQPLPACYREWFHHTHGGGWVWACPSNSEWIRDLEASAQAFNAENRGRGVNISHIASVDCPACKSRGDV